MRTSRILWTLCLFLCLPLGGARAGETLRVVATIPDVADVVKRIGGDRVDVTTITRGRENLHAVVARPSHLVAMSRADLFVQIGLSLETVFVPGLLEASRNARIQPGKPGFVNCSEGWEALDVPESVSRKDGDLHPQGNPHMNLDPRGGRQMAERIRAALEAVDPADKAGYAARARTYGEELDAAEARWAQQGKAWKGRRIVVYHKEYDYLARRYGLEIVGSIEVKPGIPPTPNHVAALIQRAREIPGIVLLTAPWSNNDQVAQIAKATGARVVELPNQVGGLRGADTWIAMMDLVHQRLAEAFDPADPAK